MTFGTYLKQRRTALGLRAEDVGAAIGRSQSWVSRLETGRLSTFPTPDELRGLAAALQVTTTDLLLAAGYLEPEP